MGMCGAQGLPLVEGMLPRIKHAERELTGSLQKCLRAALQERDQVRHQESLLRLFGIMPIIVPRLCV